MYQIIYSKSAQKFLRKQAKDDAAKIWQLIQSAFALANAPLAEPDEDETEILNAYHNGNPEYQPDITHEELMKQLGL